jgi:hypothetical protein
MTQKSADGQHRPLPSPSRLSEEANGKRQSAEAQEDAGRHKNVGQKDDKGAR